MTKHTAGPWEVNKVSVFALINGVYHSICRVSAPTKYASDGTSEANAKLIAAAPELLQALKHSIEWIQKAPHGENCYVSNHYEGDSGNQCHCSKESLENFLLAAIAKAEGESK